MKKSVILFLIVFSVGTVSGWGPLTHNAITKGAGRTSTGDLMGTCGPDIGYLLDTSGTIAKIFHDNNGYPNDKSFSRALNASATTSTQKKMAVAWLGHNAADVQFYNSKFKDLSKIPIDTLAVWEHSGSNYIDVDSTQIVNAYKKVTGKQMSTTSVNAAEYTWQSVVAAEYVAALSPNAYIAAKGLVNADKGYSTYTNYYSKAVTAYKNANL